MPISDDEERDLKVSITRADLTLKDKQAFWETPRNIAILLGAVAAVTGVVAGMAGYKYGSQTPPLMTPQPPPQIIFQPGSIVVQQPAAPAPVPGK